jgi:hypothetical protein
MLLRLFVVIWKLAERTVFVERVPLDVINPKIVRWLMVDHPMRDTDVVLVLTYSKSKIRFLQMTNFFSFRRETKIYWLRYHLVDNVLPGR